MNFSRVFEFPADDIDVHDVIEQREAERHSQGLALPVP